MQAVIIVHDCGVVWYRWALFESCGCA
jgi:hypothetical protein